MRVIRVLSVLFALAATSLIANAQTFNNVKVHLPYTVAIGSKQLAPGDYEILPIPGSAAGKLFGIYSDDRASFEALLTASPASESEPAQTTELVLHANGRGEYTVDQMWIQGHTEGYEFSAAKSDASGERQVVPSR